VKAAALIVLVLAVAARTRLTGTVLGQPVDVPVLWVIAAAMVLALLGAVLLILRGLINDGMFLRTGTAP
jgi:hypothetical protein